MPPLKLEFVVSSLEEPKLSKETRTKVRRQAMKAVVHARTQSNTFKRARRKEPVAPSMIDEEAEDEDIKSSPKARRKGNRARSQTSSFKKSTTQPPVRYSATGDTAYVPGNCYYTDAKAPRTMPLSGIDLLMSEYNICPNDLSSLTTIHHNAVVCDILRDDPSGAPYLFSKRGEEDMSFFAFVGQRYGYSECLDAALRCLFSKVKSILAPCGTISEAIILAQYGHALSSLQAAVDSPSWSDPEVLCATNVLAIFELFNLSTPTYWKQHVAGAAQLIQSRGPSCFKTPFERRLLAALYCPIICESWVNAEPCFLVDDSWREVLDSIYNSPDPISERGYLAKVHAIGMATMPMVQRRTFSAVAQDLDPSSPEVIATINDLRAMHEQCQRWRVEFIKQLAAYGKMDTRTFDTSLSLFCAGCVWNVLICLFMAILDPANRKAQLGEAIERSWEVIQGNRELSPIKVRGSLFMAQRQRIAEATVTTARVMKEAIGSDKLIEMWRLMVWFKAMQRADLGPIPRYEEAEDIISDDHLPRPTQYSFFVKMGLDLIKPD